MRDHLSYKTTNCLQYMSETGITRQLQIYYYISYLHVHIKSQSLLSIRRIFGCGFPLGINNQFRIVCCFLCKKLLDATLQRYRSLSQKINYMQPLFCPPFHIQTHQLSLATFNIISCILPDPYSKLHT